MGLLSAGAERIRESGPVLRLVEGGTPDPSTKKARQPRRRRLGRPGLAPGLTIAIVLMIAAAVTLQAQRVAGQDSLLSIRAEMREATQRQAELRASVAESEAPDEILTAAGELGMVEPAAVVALPAPSPGTSALVDLG